MKKFYNNFFRVSEHDKIKEKVLYARIGVSVLFIILCIAAVDITAYAFYTCSVTSRANTIQAANFDLEILQDTDAQSLESYYVLNNENGNQAGGFTFQLKKKEDASATVGYCKIEIAYSDDKSDVQSYYTEPIGSYIENDEEVVINTRSIKIYVPAGQTATVKFTPNWGTCACEENVLSGEPMILGDKEAARYNSPDVGVENFREADLPGTTTTEGTEYFYTPIIEDTTNSGDPSSDSPTEQTDSSSKSKSKPAEQEESMEQNESDSDESSGEKPSKSDMGEESDNLGETSDYGENTDNIETGDL